MATIVIATHFKSNCSSRHRNILGPLWPSLRHSRRKYAIRYRSAYKRRCAESRDETGCSCSEIDESSTHYNDHAHDGMAVAQKSLGFLSVSNFEYGQVTANGATRCFTRDALGHATRAKSDLVLPRPRTLLRTRSGGCPEQGRAAPFQCRGCSEQLCRPIGNLFPERSGS